MASAVLALKKAAYSSVRRFVRGACALIPDKVAVMVHEHTDLVRKLDFSERPVFLHAESDVELRVRLNSVAKEPEMLPWLRGALQPGDTFYDIGANVGAYSLLAAALHDGEVNVVAFEPSATNYAQLCRNLALNPSSRRTTPLPVALADRRSLLEFGYSDLTAGAALHGVGELVGSPNDIYTQKVLAMRLDDVIREYGLPVPNVMKIDIDGGELAMARGAEATMRDTRLRALLIELEDETPETHEVFRLLGDCGLAGTDRGQWTDAVFRGRRTRFANFMFARRA